MGGRWHCTCVRIHIFLWKGNENHEFGTGIFVHKGIISAVKRVEFVSDRMSYIILRGRLFRVIVLKVHVSQFKYLGTTVTNQNLIQEEIKRRLNSGNACYHLVQNLLSSRLLSRNLKIRICKTIVLPVVLYGSLTLREEHRLRMFKNRVLRRVFGPKRDEVTGEWRKLHIEDLHDLYSSPSIIIIIKPRRMSWAGHVARMGEKRNAYRLLWESQRKSQRERDH
jgi:hypothetical protein